MNLKCGVAPDVDGGAMVECNDGHRELLASLNHGICGIAR